MTSDPAGVPREAPRDGAWEKPGGSPLRPVIAGLLVCGALYTTVGALVLSVVVVAFSASDWSWAQAGGLVDFLLSYYRRFQVSILVVTAVMEYSIFLGLTVLLVRRWHSSRPVRYLHYRAPDARDLLLAAVGAVAIVPLAGLLDSWSYALFPVLKELRGGEAALLSVRSPGQLVLVVLAISVTPAICEETLFRGWLQGTARRRLRAVPAIAITGVLFALFHASPLSIVALAFVGFYLGFVFELSGTVAVSMTAHGLYNLTIIGVVAAAGRWPWLSDEAGDFTVPVTLAAAAVWVLVVALMALRGLGAARARGGPADESWRP